LIAERLFPYSRAGFSFFRVGKLVLREIFDA